MRTPSKSEESRRMSCGTAVSSAAELRSLPLMRGASAPTEVAEQIRATARSLRMKRIKQVVAAGARAGGILFVTANSPWRDRRLLILCYHGVSLDDEHEWNPELYMSPERFRQRLMMLDAGGYSVLP